MWGRARMSQGCSALAPQQHPSLYLLGKVQRSPRPPGPQLSVQDTVVEDILRGDCGDPAACGGEGGCQGCPDTRWQPHSRLPHTLCPLPILGGSSGTAAASAGAQLSPSWLRRGTNGGSTCRESGGEVRAPFLYSQCPPSLPLRPLLCLPVPSVPTPVSPLPLTCRCPGPASRTFPRSPQPAAGALPPSSLGGPQPK